MGNIHNDEDRIRCFVLVDEANEYGKNVDIWYNTYG